jgi:hypothetical protein
MTPSAHPRWRGPSGAAGFTMVEIALSLAIIGFALVAILKVLPFGLTVQKENRQDTVINHDAAFWMGAIRSGPRFVGALPDLPLYVDHVVRITTQFNQAPGSTPAPTGVIVGQTNFANFTTADTPLIIGLLSTPTWYTNNGLWYSNYVIAYVRALTGAAVSQLPQTNATIVDAAFAYNLSVSVRPVKTTPGSPAPPPNLQATLQEVQLNFIWPLLPTGQTGKYPYHRPYREAFGGSLQQLPGSASAGSPFQPMGLWQFNTATYGATTVGIPYLDPFGHPLP